MLMSRAFARSPNIDGGGGKDYGTIPWAIFDLSAEHGDSCNKLHLGGHLYFRLDIILVKGLSKHTLNTYFSGMKIDPKYMFLYAFFLLCPSCPFQNLSI